MKQGAFHKTLNKTIVSADNGEYVRFHMGDTHRFGLHKYEYK